MSATRFLAEGGGTYRAELDGGVFELRMAREDVPLGDLCDFALRNNQRRRFLFVSKVLGRHWPVRPAALRGVAERLARKISDALPTAGPILFIGMAETATTLGQTVYRAWRQQNPSCDALYLDSTRRPTGGVVAFPFSESHSHASAHLIHLPSDQQDPNKVFQRAARLVIVDDEATSGRTAAALASAYAGWRRADIPSALAVLLQWQGASPPSFPVLSLAEGAFTFTETGAFPTAPENQDRADAKTTTRLGTRAGITKPQQCPWQIVARPGEKILVLGTGEFGFQPFCLAESLEAQGAETFVQATTRSPILLGGAIQHRRTFSALTGESHREFLYNVPDDHPYDRVVLCVEECLPSPSHDLWKVPRIEMLAAPAES